MKRKHKTVTSASHLFLVILYIFILVSCTKMYIGAERNEAAGLNGSFEIADGGYSVNWFYNAPPLKEGSAQIVMDSTVVMDGRRSLKIIAGTVKESDRVWMKPGLFTRIPVVPGKKYRLSFGARNRGGAFYARWVSVSANAKQHLRSSFVVRTADSFTNWKVFSDTLRIKERERAILLEFILTQSGSLWIDRVMFEELYKD